MKKQAYHVVKRQPRHPSTKFVAWVRQYGPIRLARSLMVSRSSVHAWVTPRESGRRPSLENAYDMIALSRIEPLNGEQILTIPDILGDVKITRMEEKQ